MTEGLAKVATGFAMISEGINEIILRAQDNKSSNPQDEKQGEVPTHEKVALVINDTKDQKIEISKEEVRAVLAKKSQEGKTKQVKALLNKYGAKKLTSVKEADYESIMKEAEVI